MKGYTVKYRLRGERKWYTLKNIIGDGIEHNFRWFADENDNLTHISMDSVVKFDTKRAESIIKRMSKEAGQPVQRA